LREIVLCESYFFSNQNPKSEYRNPKQRQHSNSKFKNRNAKRAYLQLPFRHLDLFRISDFEFRIFSGFRFPWRLCWLSLEFKLFNRSVQTV